MSDDEIIKYLVEKCGFNGEPLDQPRNGTRLRHRQHRGREGSIYVGKAPKRNNKPYVAATGPYVELERIIPLRRSYDGPMHGYPNWEAERIMKLLKYLEVNNPPPIF